MNSRTIEQDPIRHFWDERAKLGPAAGSNDVIAKKLEIKALMKYVSNGMRILDVGCGNGITAIEISRVFRVDITGIDFSKEMIAAAKKMALDKSAMLQGHVEFQVGNITESSWPNRPFDLVYSERTLINLTDWPTQRQAIESIGELLTEGGCYAMCENSQDGLDAINKMRQDVGLDCISPPWHNRYFREEELSRVSIPGLRLEEVIDYSSTYYFLSRVVNAQLAAKENRQPAYDAPINELSLVLPSIGDFGQGKVWLWRKV